MHAGDGINRPRVETVAKDQGTVKNKRGVRAWLERGAILPCVSTEGKLHNSVPGKTERAQRLDDIESTFMVRLSIGALQVFFDESRLTVVVSYYFCPGMWRTRC